MASVRSSQPLSGTCISTSSQIQSYVEGVLLWNDEAIIKEMKNVAMIVGGNTVLIYWVFSFAVAS